MISIAAAVGSELRKKWSGRIPRQDKELGGPNIVSRGQDQENRWIGLMVMVCPAFPTDVEDLQL